MVVIDCSEGICFMPVTDGKRREGGKKEKRCPRVRLDTRPARSYLAQVNDPFTCGQA